MRKKRRKNKGGGKLRGWFGILRGEVEADWQRRGEPPHLSQDQVLAWADAFFARTGEWPMHRSGPIPEAPGETWLLVEAALTLGLRGFTRGGSIPRFLDEHRGRYNCRNQRFTVAQILDWADAWQAEMGVWPMSVSGAIPGAGGVNWQIVDRSLKVGRGVLPAGSSLAHLLATERGVLAPYTEEQILAWADAFHARTGQWPTSRSGPIADAPGEAWSAVQSALQNGTRGLPGGSSLTRLLITGRGIRSWRYLPPLTIPQVLAWADAHHQRTGRWPGSRSGPIPDATGETWQVVDGALRAGDRGLPGGTTLAVLLVEHREKRSVGHTPALSMIQILAWADAFRAQNGRWPTYLSGPVEEAPGETWCAINSALRAGSRGLAGGSTLSRLLARERNAKHARDGSLLMISEILAWADAHCERHGKWPTQKSGPIPEARGETWLRVSGALEHGRSGLPGGITLARLLSLERGAPYSSDREPFTAEGILAWADAHHTRTGDWPDIRSGPIPEAPGRAWKLVAYALRHGTRGLPGGSSLSRFLSESGRTGRRIEPRDLTISRSSPALTHSSHAPANDRTGIRAQSSKHPARTEAPSIAPS
jgi:hypothetical protein